MRTGFPRNFGILYWDLVFANFLGNNLIFFIPKHVLTWDWTVETENHLDSTLCERFFDFISEKNSLTFSYQHKERNTQDTKSDRVWPCGQLALIQTFYRAVNAHQILLLGMAKFLYLVLFIRAISVFWLKSFPPILPISHLEWIFRYANGLGDQWAYSVWYMSESIGHAWNYFLTFYIL